MTTSGTHLALAHALVLVAACSGEGTRARPDEPPRSGTITMEGDLGGATAPGARVDAANGGATNGAAGLDAMPAPSGPLGTDWHPDADGDGVLAPSDTCPTVYDPQNRAASCDPSVDAPAAGHAIDDLRAEHVTPYGAWLTFRSNETSEWGYYAEVAFSETKGDVVTAAGFDAAVLRGDTARVRVNERLGDAIPAPIVIARMKPGTDYELTVRDSASRIGKPLSIRTQPAPVLARPTTFPRVYATAPFVAELRARAASGEASFVRWKTGLVPKIDRALTGADIEDEKYCNAAALIGLATQDASLVAKAKTLHGKLVTRWEAGSWSGNGYRWADAALATCTDLLWSELDPATRERAVTATLASDERAITGSDFRLDDTDEAQSSIRTWLIDGLVGCGAPGISAAASARACAILDSGMRYWHGWMLPQTRRDRGFMALSGGSMPDSTRYAQGSSQYWAQAFWVTSNQGAPLAEYAPWIAHNLLATYLEPTTPSGKGVAAYGDIDKYQVGADPEPNSCAIDAFHFDVLALQAGLLAKAGRAREAGWARHYLAAHGGSDVYQNRVHMLMFDSDAIAKVDPRASGTEAPRAFLDSGFGLLYDRTSWSESASMLTFRGGWSGVDHSQEEQGNFGLYRRGRWVTHASLAYEGEATHAQGHNVLQLGVLYNHGEQRAGQYAFRNNGPAAVLRRSTSNAHTYAHGDYTAAYQSGFTAYYAYDSVQRAVVWLKGDEHGSADTLVVYDRVENAPAAPAGGARSFQIHLDGAPTLAGRTASLEVDGVGARQRLDVTAVVPESATLSTVAPSGAPGNAQDAIYTYRLSVEPNAADATLHMVNVLAVADAPSAPPPATGIDTGDWVGAKVGTNAVLFPKGRLARSTPPTSVTLTLPAGVTRAYLAGLAPSASYAVARTLAANGATVVTATPGGSVAADDAGMMILEP